MKCCYRMLFVTVGKGDVSLEWRGLVTWVSDLSARLQWGVTVLTVLS